MELNIREEKGFKYLDEGKGETLIFLHGLFGALSNWNKVLDYFSKKYRVIIPMLPIYDMPLKEADLEGLLKFVEEFIELKKLNDFVIVGNSLGGHVGLMYTLKNQHKVNRLVLTGSSGLFEDTMGGSYPRRGSYEFVKKKVEYTFYDPTIATKELIDEVFEITRSIPTCLRMVSIARSAQKHNLAKDLSNIRIPTLLIWGLNDTITPPIVAHEFNKLIPNTELRFIDKCGHAPMMEHPEEFNKLFENFLEKNKVLI
ncbi:alpha/beta fold hydrolase [Chondrinema litorale]|uniref:alpha/beta fold hydrolase n=1 Tax=Chondrinema litorale TaxID=2994555 RepID=UPI0025432AA4|nr:alpha/beta hydrolase [Chondrinema litorale]UZR95480.1 alpha/beta hydrolase [Chondrinema litorale]